MKKIVSIIIAIATMLALSINAFAAEPYEEVEREFTRKEKFWIRETFEMMEEIFLHSDEYADEVEGNLSIKVNYEIGKTKAVLNAKGTLDGEPVKMVFTVYATGYYVTECFEDGEWDVDTDYWDEDDLLSMFGMF